MNGVNLIGVVVLAYLAIFFQSASGSLRNLIGAQFELLPSLMVCTSLVADLPAVALLAVLGGCGLDSLSANPLGVSVLPLFATGFVIHRQRDLILRDQFYAQGLLGFAASATAPALTLLMLWMVGQFPALHWVSLWQWLVVALGGALFTPAFFRVFDLVERAFSHPRLAETSFRSDREIKRGRS